MRLWSIHPSYLDPTGLTACWREGLLARKVLLGETKGYLSHPQLLRFKHTEDPLLTIESYLCTILDESIKRGYNFNSSKIQIRDIINKITVTSGQLEYEFEHLRMKLKKRNPLFFDKIESVHNIIPNPIFRVIKGEIENWEIIK